MSRNRQNAGKQGTLKCFLCGICCLKLRVAVDIDEGNRLARKMGMDWEKFLNNYLDPFYVATDRFLIRQINGKCIFLNQVNGKQALCSINGFKPSSCIEWSANAFIPECKSGLKHIWNLSVKLNGEIKGKVTDIIRFKNFVDSISSI